MPTAVVKSLFRFSAFQTKLILVCCTLKKKKDFRLLSKVATVSIKRKTNTGSDVFFAW